MIEENLNKEEEQKLSSKQKRLIETNEALFNKLMKSLKSLGHGMIVR